MNLRVVAEGVETQAQADFLRHHGCDAIQGYLLSQPLLPEAFPGWLARQQHEMRPAGSSAGPASAPGD